MKSETSRGYVVRSQYCMLTVSALFPQSINCSRVELIYDHVCLLFAFPAPLTLYRPYFYTHLWMLQLGRGKVRRHFSLNLVKAQLDSNVNMLVLSSLRPFIRECMTNPVKSPPAPDSSIQLPTDTLWVKLLQLFHITTSFLSPQLQIGFTSTWREGGLA